MNGKNGYSVKSASFHVLKNSIFLGICTENIMVLSPSQIMNATYAITPAESRYCPCTCTRNIMVPHCKTFECNKCDFSANRNGVLKNHKHLKHGEEATLFRELCDYRTPNAQYLKSHIQT